MALQEIYARIAEAPFCDRLSAWTRAPQAGARTLQVKGAAGSIPAFLLHYVQEHRPHPILCLLPEEESASYLFSDLEQLGGAKETALRLPTTGQKPYDDEAIIDPAGLIARGDVLQRLKDGFTGIVVASVEALVEMVPPPETVRQETMVLSVGETHRPQDLVSWLTDRGFGRTEFVEHAGEVAVRGGILDIFPYTGEYPVRIEFFGDEVDSIREFDPLSQRSISRMTQARVVPNLERTDEPIGTYTPIFEHLPPDTLLVTFDEAGLVQQAEALFGEAAEAYAALSPEAADAHVPPAQRYLDGDRLQQALLTHTTVRFGTFTDHTAEEQLALEARPQPAFNSTIGLLRQKLQENARAGIETFILCDSRGQEARLRELLSDGEELPFRMAVESLHEGFELPERHLAVYTDHQIFNRYHRPTARKRRKQRGGLSLRDLQNLTPGDFVVHIDYGIGKFAGMEKIEVRGKQQESVRVLFAGGDKLYVNVNALHKLHKYTGKEGHQPRLTKLGSGQWERTTARTKKRVKTIARDLIKLYAKRKESAGFAFSPDTVWQRELEASFQFEDTPDQASTAEAVKEDMQQPVPMDRLVCGDVGFGKTEIAVRAAFKAVQDGKQVAVLVPTTILAEQHHDTFNERLDRYPVRIGAVSRFKSTKEQKETLQHLAEGELDIIIGTHRLASKDVQFKNLGLLIIDEEQRFGVSVKERLRKMRAEVDTLTLTATPIPRTLQFSLLGARDLSIISTPPPNRHPIVTEIHTFDQDLIRDAILYETSRGGQVFFIHNRVKTIEETAAMLRAAVPDVRIRVAHGQMKSAQLERVMMDFVDNKFDVLVSTNIIESGLDISNVNTIVINHAERFGLSELHQLRGRVGRSDRKAFCYLLVPSIHTLTKEAKQRLQAVEEFSDLGSGFNLAMRDLDIRGAGSLLGAEQSGFIEDVGYETYHKILDEAVQELREEEFSGLFDQAPVPRAEETTVDVEEDAFIPESYLSNTVERLNLYKRISETETEADLAGLREEMIDRFGPLPPEVDNLFAAAEIKLLAQSLRLPKVLFKNQRLFLETPTQEDDPYFYEHLFYPFLERLAGLERRYVLKDKGKKLRAIVQDVPNLAEAEAVLQKLIPAEQEEAVG